MSSEGEKKVKGNDNVTIEYLKGAKHHNAGDKSVVHSFQADKLVKKGIAKIVK